MHSSDLLCRALVKIDNERNKPLQSYKLILFLKMYMFPIILTFEYVLLAATITCTDNPCVKNATCISSRTGYKCNCGMGYAYDETNGCLGLYFRNIHLLMYLLMYLLLIA